GAAVGADPGQAAVGVVVIAAPQAVAVADPGGGTKGLVAVRRDNRLRAAVEGGSDGADLAFGIRVAHRDPARVGDRGHPAEAVIAIAGRVRAAEDAVAAAGELALRRVGERRGIRRAAASGTQRAQPALAAGAGVVGVVAGLAGIAGGEQAPERVVGVSQGAAVSAGHARALAVVVVGEGGGAGVRADLRPQLAQAVVGVAGDLVARILHLHQTTD